MTLDEKLGQNVRIEVSRIFPNEKRKARIIYLIGENRKIVAQSEEHPYYSDYLVFQAKYLIGESSFFLGQYEEALTLFDEIISAEPLYPSYLLPWSHLRRGTIYNLTEQKEKANAGWF